MVERIDIKGGADEFEAAVIAAVLDRISKDERSAQEMRVTRNPSRVPAWVRALMPDDPDRPRDTVVPDVV